MPPPRPDDDNITRRWLLAQALGEQALATVAMGDASAAAAFAAQALALWEQPLPPGGPPPSLRPWMEPVKALVSR